MLLLVFLVACSALGGGDDDVCERWTARKAGECRDQVSDATLTATSGDSNQPTPLLQPFTLRDQCELFPERKVLVAECVEKPDCDGFAQCGFELAEDAFYPPESPNLCSAFLARGGSKEVGDRCATDEDLKAGVAACMMVDDGKFTGCAAELSK